MLNKLLIALTLIIIIFTIISCGNEAKSWYDKGWQFSNQKNYEEAIASYDKAIEIDPKYSDAWYNKGLTFDKMEKYQDGITCYDKVIELKPDNQRAWSNKGLDLYKTGKYDEAIKCYDKALELNPKDNLTKTYKKEAEKVIANMPQKTTGGTGGVNPYNTKGIMNKTNSAVDAYNKAQQGNQ